MPVRGAHPVEWLRDLAVSLERLAVEGVASGAVRGATDELRAGLPDDADEHLRTLLRDGLAVLERFLAEAAGSGTSPLAAWSRATAEGAVRGAVEELRRLAPELRPTTQEVLVRLKLWLDRSAAEAAARSQVIHSPGDRMRIAAAGATAGAAEELSAVLPQLATPAAEFASSVGRGFVRGAAGELGHQVRLAARSPLLLAMAAGGAVLALLLAWRRG
jgi:hypothetical protein